MIGQTNWCQAQNMIFCLVITDYDAYFIIGKCLLTAGSIVASKELNDMLDRNQKTFNRETSNNKHQGTPIIITTQ